MSIPDLIGQDWEKVQALLAKTSYVFKKFITTPPWSGEGQGQLRVIRQKVVRENELEITIAYDNYLRIK